MSTAGRVIILGGGPAGMAAADACAEGGQAFLVLERASELGGLAQSVAWADYGLHDLGPHKIFTLDQRLLSRVKALLPPDGWLVREKRSRIFLNGHYLPYPPSPFALINVFGVSRFSGMVLDYGLARLRSLARRRTPDTFAEDLKQRVGARLYDVLFRPIAEKLWGDGKKLDAKLSKGRVQTPRLSEVLGRLLKIKKVSEFEALEFIYPKNGLQTLWETIRTKGQGVGAFVTGAEVRALEVESGRVVGIEYFNSGGQQLETISVSEHDFVFSTLPIALLADLLRPAPSAATRRLIQEKIVLNDLMLVFLHIDLPSLFEDSWIFVPDPEIIFHRVCEQKAFDPGMTPHGSVVCCEVMNNELRARGGLSDAELERAAEEGLRKMGFRSFRVQHQRVIRLPQSYPVFRPGFEEALDAILKEFDAIENCRTIGRQGAFNYIGTLDAMDIGYGAAEWFLTKARGQSAAAEKAAAWRAERERTRHYPVLD